MKQETYLKMNVLLLQNTIRFFKLISLSILIVCSASQGAIAQYFNRLYIDNRPAMRFESIHLIDSAYYIYGTSASNIPPYKTKIFVGQIGLNGEWKTGLFAQDTDAHQYGGYANFDVSQNKTKKAIGYIEDSVVRPYIINIDSNDSIYRTDIIPATGLIYFGPKQFILDSLRNAYIVCDIQYPNFDVNSCVIKINEHDSILWTKTFGVNNLYDISTSITFSQSGSLLIGGQRTNLSLPNLVTNTFIYELDTNGLLLNQWVDNSGCSFGAYALKVDQSGLYYVTKLVHSQDAGYAYCNSAIFKRDIGFHKLWDYQEDTGPSQYGLNDLEIGSNGVFACGSRPAPIGMDAVLSGWLIHLDLQGNLIWERDYSPFDGGSTFGYLEDISLVDANKYAICGYGINSDSAYQAMQGWLIVVDSNGCLDNNCWTDASHNVNYQPFKIDLFPNISGGIINLYLSEDTPNGDIEIYDVIGNGILYQKAESKTVQIDLSAYSAGEYILVYKSIMGCATGKVILTR